DSSDDAIVSKNLDGIVTSWNRAAERMYGYKAEEIVGQSFSVLLQKDQPDDVPAILGKLRKGERIEHHETTRVTKGGGLVPVALTYSPIHDGKGNVIGGSSIARDITERRRTEDKFRGFLEAA